MGRPSQWSIGTRLMLVGLVLAVAGILGVARTAGTGALRLSRVLANGSPPDATVALLLLATLGVLLFVLGMTLYVLLPSLSPRSAERGYGSIGTILACGGVAVVLSNLISLPYFLLNNGGSITTQLAPSGIVVAVISLDLSLVLILFLRVVRPGALSWPTLGLTAPHLDALLPAGVLLGIGVLVLTALITLALRAVGVDQNQIEEFAGVRAAPFPQFVGVLLATAVVAPICEELFFRGYVFTALLRRYGPAVGYVGSALLFAVAHLNAQAFLPIFIIGIAFAMVFHRTGSLVPSMIAHALNNGIGLIALYYQLGQ